MTGCLGQNQNSKVKKIFTHFKSFLNFDFLLF